MEISAPESIRRKRIVVIDDQGSMRGVLSAFLRELGFSAIDCMVDGVEGLKLMESHPVDLVICDWNMPKISGLEVLQTVRSCEDTKSLPFLMVTSSSELERVKSAVESGVSDYLIKPFQPGHFGQKVIKILSNSEHKAKTYKRQRVEIVSVPASVDEHAQPAVEPEAGEDKPMLDAIAEPGAEGTVSTESSEAGSAGAEKEES